LVSKITGNAAMPPSRPGNVGDVTKEVRVGSILGRHVLGTNAGILIDGVIYLLEGAPPIGKTKVGGSTARRRTFKVTHVGSLPGTALRSRSADLWPALRTMTRGVHLAPLAGR
jgi:hypothetical protein